MTVCWGAHIGSLFLKNSQIRELKFENSLKTCKTEFESSHLTLKGVYSSMDNGCVLLNATQLS